ncbi:hypothetical protein EC991_000570 [Linnemannia zychae]|nr:hypothetical protein EC991_000570 [Linnemannia zychae]
MKIPRSVLTAVAALLVASISCAQQDPIEATGNSNNVDDASVEPTVGDPVGFINAGQGRFISITGSEYEAIQRGERPETMNKFGEKLEPEDNAVGTAVVLSEDEKQSILDAHNSVRALHDSPPVTWNDEIAKFGDDYLQPCNFKHSGGKYGENLAYGYRNFTVAVRAWYDEVVKYDFDNPGFRKGTGKIAR